MKKNEIIELNSNILEDVSMEELEERLELADSGSTAQPWFCDNCPEQGCYCYTGDSHCNPVNEA